MRPKTPLTERWAACVQKTETCWLWMGRKYPRGYGGISAGGRAGRQLYAHRVAWDDGNVKVRTLDRLDSFVRATAGKRLTYEGLIQ